MEEKQAAQLPTETTTAAAAITAAAEEEEGREAAAAAQALSVQRPACRRRENTRSCTTKEDPASRTEERVNPQERRDDQPEDEDWKHKVIAGPGIPRPKLVTLADPDERRTRTPQGEEEEGALGGICHGVLQPQTATVGPASCQEDLAPAAERWREGSNCSGRACRRRKRKLVEASNQTGPSCKSPGSAKTRGTNDRKRLTQNKRPLRR